ncbi:MAG TPA: hypothetical protein VD713_06630 [Sphingomonadales bacterium]|nr:hypothetical protein [Sphingomonadales bacterium]
MKTRIAIALAFGAAFVFSAAAPAWSAHHEQDVQDQGADVLALYYADRLAAPERLDADKAKDESRKPAEVFAKIGLKPDQVVIDLGTGRGYYAENFARVTGATVYAVNTPEVVEKFPQVSTDMAARLDKLPYGNIRHEIMALAALPSAWQADVAFIGMYYHDVASDFFSTGTAAEAVNAAVFNALKPGGLYVIEDHIAPAGSGVETGSTTHRIDPVIIREQVSAAGFELVEENFDLFANPGDPLTISVFDESIRGKTARVLYIFRKPAN